jgi:IS4 transposase
MDKITRKTSFGQWFTNRIDLRAEEISEMYRSRWAIELFFKWITTS